MKTILYRNLRISVSSWPDLLQSIQTAFKTPGLDIIVTLNPQAMVLSSKDKYRSLFKTYFAEASLILPESEGLVWALSRECGNFETSALTRKPGIDLFQKLLSFPATVYLLGASQSVSEASVAKIKVEYPDCHIVGHHHGFFLEEESSAIYSEIAHLNPDLIFVAMGMPRQEQLILDLKSYCKSGVIIGIGGSLDVFSGRLKRAPLWMRLCKLEWLFRGLQEPKRVIGWSYLLRFCYNTLRKKGF
tara:strand:- start:3401 stop:4135 length:735 start_codon:yes stop_codon:yes gene_type:complete